MSKWEAERFEYPSRIPTMISPEERQYLYWLGRHVWTDSGHVVEIGPWLGGSTICLLMGMRARQSETTFTLHVFDSFLWRDFMSLRAPLSLVDGESFQSQFEANVSDFDDIVKVHRKSLPDDERPLDNLAATISGKEGVQIDVLDWQIDEPVEILFVDGAKTWTGMKYLLNVFSPHLLPGKSILVFQDYKHWGAYWVPLIAEQLMDYFELLHNCRSNTVSFLLKKPIPLPAILALRGIHDTDLSDGLGLLDSASRRLAALNDQLGALILQSSKVRYCLNKGFADMAVKQFRALESDWPRWSDAQTVDRLRAWLDEETNSRHPPTIRWRCNSPVRKIWRTLHGHF